MKKIIIYSTLLAFLVSCSATTDKKSELEKLKQQREQLNSQIAQLEAEVNPEGEIVELKAVAVQVSPSVECEFNHYIQVQGTVDGDQNIAVSPQMGGLVTAVYVKEGTPVKKGQVMAELDAQVTKQSLEEVNTQLELANSIFEKQSALWDKKIGSEVQYLQAKTNKESLERRINTIKEQLKMAQIVSPISGTVESNPLRVGQMASPGMPTSTIRVINMSVAKISADVAETYATRIKDGNTALVSFPDLGKDIETKLNFTSRYIDPTNRTFKVECKISSKDVSLRANMIAYLKIKDYTNEKAFCVPVNYIQSDQDGKFIYVAKQNGDKWTAEKRLIKTGMDYDGTVEILEGLTAGENIITAGFQNLNPGEIVTF
ncbi:MAG: efflux RND transporter periplasmic adaptor subunit [Prolixibacteraceae bacterium]